MITFKKVTLFLLCLPMMASALTTINLCFEDKTQLNPAKSFLEDILLQNEFVDIRRRIGCLEVSIREYRKELTLSYMRRKFRFRLGSSIGGRVRLEQKANLNGQPKMCRMSLEEVFKSNSNQQQVKVGKSSKLSAKGHTSEGYVTSELLLSSGIAGTIRVNKDVINITCTVKSSTNYDVSFSLGRKLISTVQLIKGQKLNVGDLVSQSKGQGQEVSTKGIEKNTSGVLKKTSYFLSIK